MKQVINIMLDINPERANIPKKFKPHMTLVYPFEISDQSLLYNHILKSIKNISPFKIKFKGLKKSVKDYYLYLLVQNGKSNILKLYKKLNSGILKDFKNPDMPKYIPHISLGIFKSKKDIENAMRNPKFKNQEYSVKISSIQLLTLKKDDSIKSIKKFNLK